MYFLLLVALLLATPAWADITVSLENDCPWQTDQDFSHGTKIMYNDDPTGWSYGVMQSMYTPHDKQTQALVPDAPPYAGWLSAVIVRTWHAANHSDSLETLVGTVGKYSGAEQTQAWVHRQLGCRVPQGWDNQVQETLAVNAIVKRTYEPDICSWFDVNPYMGVAAGNVMDYMCSGVTLYLGHKLPGHHTSPGITLKAEPAAPYRAWLYAGVEGRVVLYNALLQDDRFDTSIERFVGDVFYGGVVQIHDFQARVGALVRTPEYEQSHELHRVALLDLTWLF